MSLLFFKDTDHVYRLYFYPPTKNSVYEPKTAAPAAPTPSPDLVHVKHLYENHPKFGFSKWVLEIIILNQLFLCFYCATLCFGELCKPNLRLLFV